MVRVRGGLVVGVCVVVLAGCGAQKAEPAGLTASPTPAASASPTPSPTPAEDAATDLSDAELGIVFVDTPDLTGPAASAHDAVAIFEVEYWRSKTTGATSPALAQFASPELLRKVEYGVQRNSEDGFGFDGTLHITISDVTIDGGTATASVCADYSDVLFTNVDGSAPQSFQEIDFPQYERSTTRLSTFDDGATWRPEDATFEGNSC
ncbi:hypothetical protein [Cellulomonas sp. KH9]|uniref:hypothetical protein n=1 Tax=Cellulomonas sp. KH9 TaxID=1855324 RepID=UPI00116058DD|nr:hypothetical protein [Cellulomonas sp. KH9]